MVSLFASRPRKQLQETARSLPPDMRQLIVDLRVEMPNMSIREIAEICDTRFHRRPYGMHPDEHFPTADLDVFKIIGERGTEITGYPCISTYHDFRYYPKAVMHGAMNDHAYEHHGWFAFTPELWDLPTLVGIGPRDWIGWLRWHPEEDDLKLMRWNDEEEEGRAFTDWTPFEHPQLGLVEIGGWDSKFHQENLPVRYLPEDEYLDPCYDLREPVSQHTQTDSKLAGR